ncbi:leucine-rich repeat protein kinase family protein [Tasmannia lanceolata]|uniref:leucine-rich repeat protein kinase family protein n=1 Tax=Tasmannia lanceolata TaxID=3420 RepID=UPI0040631A1F
MVDLQRVFLSLFFLSLLLKFSFILGQPLSSSTELSALFDLRSSLGLRSKDWPRKADPCSAWHGVRCQSGRVVGLNLSGLRRTRLGRINPQFSVDALANLTSLSYFNSSGFFLPGPIPDWFGSNLSSLSVLDLRFSSIISSIPSSLGNLPNLTHLYLSNNVLTGTIPETLGQLSTLLVLDLSQNLLTGFIPPSLSSLHNLTLLHLSANFLSGPIPPSLGSLLNLASLHLSDNSLTLSIPNELGNLTLLRDLDLSLNLLSGTLPNELGGLRNLRRIALANNSLTGPLPPNVFSNLQKLQSIVLNHNNFNSALPDVLWFRSELHFLDASYNNLTGTIPNRTSIANASDAIFNLSYNLLYGSLTSQLERFSFIDLSGNYFQGRVPDGTSLNASVNDNCLQNVSNQKSLQDCQSFYAARGLNFNGIGPTHDPTSPPAQGDKNNQHLKFILLGVFGGIVFIALLVLLVALFLCRRRQVGTADQREISANPVPSVGGLPPYGISINFASLGEAFTYRQLLGATKDFGDSNLIKHGHSGDLYRGILEGGIPIVVKRINVNTLKRDAYMKELDLFSSASHSRLVPLLGHCLEHENEKLLVYKFMPNGDLSNALFRKTTQEGDGLQSLDWITRVKIAIGAAEALSYLHHECNPPLVHRDVQASSILLDDKFEVRFGSLSELCIQEGDGHQNVLTRFLRLSQTSEQGLTGPPSTCAYDVYCLGKVLLELVTGKLGMSASNNANTNEWLEYALPYININEKELMTKIVDPSLILDEDLFEEVWAMAIVAKSCLNPKPSKRPLTRYILKALENPLKVVREENSGSARLRTTSSRGSWNAAFFGSIREATILKRSGTAYSQGSLQGGDVSSSHKRLSNEIFPEPAGVRDIERQDGD